MKKKKTLLDLIKTSKIKRKFLQEDKVLKVVSDAVEYVKRTRLPKVIMLRTEAFITNCDDVYMTSVNTDLTEILKPVHPEIVHTCSFASDKSVHGSDVFAVVGLFHPARLLQVPLNRLIENETATLRVPILPSQITELCNKIDEIIERDKHNFIGSVACVSYSDEIDVRENEVLDDGFEADEISSRGMTRYGSLAFSPFVHVNVVLLKNVISLNHTGLVK